MAIAYKSAGAGNGTETNGAALTAACPATVDANDILIAHVIYTGTDTGPSTPDGWSALYGPANVGTTATARHWVFGKLAVGNEDGATISFGTDGGTNGRAGRIYSFSGYVSGTLAAVVPSASFSSTPHATDPQGPSVTTTVAGALAVACMCQDDNNSEQAIAGASGGTWGGHQEYSNATWGPQGVALYLNVATPTANPGTISGGAIVAANDEAGTIGFEIRPNPPPVFADIRQDILDGIVSAQSETHGWNAERSNIPVTAVVRTSDTVVTITLPALGDYDITAQETLTVTVPAAALTGGSQIVASPTVTVDPGSGGTALAGAAASSLWSVISQTLVASAVALSGAVASFAGVVPAQTLTTQAVELSGSAATATWAVPAQSVAIGAAALSGAAPASTGTVQAHTLAPGTASLGGTAAVATWTIPAQTVVSIGVSLSGSAPAATWTLPAQTLAAGTVALSGAWPSSAWSLPAQSAAPGAVALGGSAASAAWALPAQTILGLVADATHLTWTWSGSWQTSWKIYWDTDSGTPYAHNYAFGDADTRTVALADFLTQAGTYYAVVVAINNDGEGTASNEVVFTYTPISTLTGAEASAAWAAPSHTLATGAIGLSGAAASAAWAVPVQTLGIGTVAVAGDAASASWALPLHILAGQSVPLTGDAPSAQWATPEQSLAAGSVALSGAAPASTWGIPSQALGVGTAPLSGNAAAAAWSVPAQTLSSAGQLAGPAASARWLLPTHTLGSGAIGISGSVPSAAWAVPAQGVSHVLAGAAPSAAWAVGTHALTTWPAPLTGAAARASWAVPAHRIEGARTIGAVLLGPQSPHPARSTDLAPVRPAQTAPTRPRRSSAVRRST